MSNLNCWAIVRPPLARTLAMCGHWSMSASAPSGELASLLPMAPIVVTPEGEVCYECEPAQLTALAVWADSLRRDLRAHGALNQKESAGLAQWVRRLRECAIKRGGGATPIASRPASPATPQPLATVNRKAGVQMYRWTPERYAQHCMASVRELVEFAQGSAWDAGTGPWDEQAPS